MKFTQFKLSKFSSLLIAAGYLFSIGCTDAQNEVSSTVKAGADIQSPVLAAVSSILVNAEGEAVDPDPIAKAPYLLVYYSAHWCPPCRMFTPKLVEFYNQNGGGEKFDLIFVSSDKSEEAMYGYMKEEKMPWAAVKYGEIGKTNIKDFGGPYIPSLVMFDKTGKLVIGTDYDNEIEPTAVLKKLMESI